MEAKDWVLRGTQVRGKSHLPRPQGILLLERQGWAWGLGEDVGVRAGRGVAHRQGGKERGRVIWRQWASWNTL